MLFDEVDKFDDNNSINSLSKIKEDYYKNVKVLYTAQYLYSSVYPNNTLYILILIIITI